MPLWVLCGLLVVVVLLAPPHTAAQGALLPDVLPGSAYEAGLAVRHVTNQAAQVAGFASGGVLVALLSPSAALGLDALSFVVSAVILRLGVRARPAPAVPTGPRAQSPGWLADVGTGLRAVFADRRRRLLAGAVWLVGCYVVPEALAAPYAAELGSGPVTVGLLMAADPAGSVIGAVLVMRFVPDAMRERSVGPLAILAGAPLALCALGPGVVGSLVLWALAGAAATACLVQAQALFVRSVPDALRGRAIGVAASALITAQGLAVLLGGLVAEAWGARTAVAACGAAGAVLAVMLLIGLRRSAVHRNADVSVATVRARG